MWLGNQPSYEAACEVRDAAAKRGTLVHEYCEAINKGQDLDLRDDKKIIEEMGLDINEIAKYMMSYDLWRHECERIFVDRMIDNTDKEKVVNFI